MTNETKVVRMDGSNKLLSLDMATGIVDRPNSYYPTALKCEAARQIFLSWVGIVLSHEVQKFIAACNRAAKRKSLSTFEEYRDAALVYAGIWEAPVKAGKPHATGCRCPRCSSAHVKNGCRRINCSVCG